MKGPRATRARLATIVAALPISTILNPLGTAIALIPFLERLPVFGHPSWTRLGVALALQCMASLWALLIHRRYRDGSGEFAPLERQLFALQITVSCCWGAAMWLLWDPASPVNHLYVALIMVTVGWNVVFTRVSHTPIFLAGILPLALALWTRTLLASDSVSLVLSQLLPIWLTYIVLLGIAGRVSVDAAFRTTFAKEDLSAALAASNAVAQRKRFEAEAANAAKSTFLANMSHELRTPLNAILGFSDLIAKQALGPAGITRYAEYAGDIHASGVHLLSLINDLLDIAKIEAGRMEIDPNPLDAHELVEEVVRLMGPRIAAHRQTVTVQAGPDLPLVTADERALKQIVLNLLSNAVKFTPEGGRIAVALGRGPRDGFVLAVEDNGPGIAPEKLQRVFTPFAQVDNRYDRAGGGTGLGLALVRGLAELHGGSCTIDSEVGRGTKVSVYLPLAIEAVPARAAANR